MPQKGICRPGETHPRESAILEDAGDHLVDEDERANERRPAPLPHVSSSDQTNKTCRQLHGNEDAERPAMRDAGQAAKKSNSPRDGSGCGASLGAGKALNKQRLDSIIAAKAV